MRPSDERFDAKTTVLIENVSHHIEGRGAGLFPKVRAGLSRTQLRDIGERMIELRKKAPHKPAAPSALKKVLDAVVS
jgi:hypothetical protein